MTYVKPKNVSFTKMAMFIDATVYTDAKDDELIFQYLYHLFYMFATKGNYFRHFEDYDGFAIFAASNEYLRLTDRRQFEPVEGKKPLDKIKSVLNHIKATLRAKKIEYQNTTFSEVINPLIEPNIDSYTLYRTLCEGVQTQYNEGLERDIIDIICGLPSKVNEIIDESPYKSNKVTRKNIYVSCLISFIKSVTLNNNNKGKIVKKQSDGRDVTDMIGKLYAKEREDCITLWKLDSDMYNYISLLVNRIRKIIIQEVSSTSKTYELPEGTLDAILKSSFEPFQDGEDDSY